MLKNVSSIVLSIIVAAALFILVNGIISVSSVYSPKFEEQIETQVFKDAPEIDGKIRALTFNTTHAALGSEGSVRGEGGRGERADADTVLKNIRGISEIVNLSNAGLVFLQDVDIDSYRSRYVNEADFYLQSGSFSSSSFAFNTRVKSTSFLPPYKKLSCGTLTLSKYKTEGSNRVALPEFRGKYSEAENKACMLINRYPVKNSDKFLYTINFELGKYLKKAEIYEQTSALLSYAESLYKDGNYVLLGGSFYRSFEDSEARYPLSSKAVWTPHTMDEDEVASGWQFVYDSAVATARLLSAPFDKSAEDKQVYVGDGFVASPNIAVSMCVTVDTEFRYSAHNPVMMEFTLKSE